MRLYQAVVLMAAGNEKIERVVEEAASEGFKEFFRGKMSLVNVLFSAGFAPVELMKQKRGKRLPHGFASVVGNMLYTCAHLNKNAANRLAGEMLADGTDTERLQGFVSQFNTPAALMS